MNDKILTSNESVAAALLGRSFDRNLLEFALTSDQIKWGLSIEQGYVLASICWMSNLREEPLPWEPSPNQILKNMWYFDLAWKRANELQCLWKLLESGEPYIQAQCRQEEKSYPFCHIVNLFLSIMNRQAYNAFRLYFKKYHVFSNTEDKKYLKLALKLTSGKKLKPHEYKTLNNYTNQYYKNDWLDFSIFTLDKVAANNKNQTIEILFNNYLNALNQRLEMELAGRKNTRDSKRFRKFSSDTLYQGKLYPANNKGGTYPLDKF